MKQYTNMPKEELQLTTKNQKYVKQGDKVYFVGKETTKPDLLQEYTQKINALSAWREKALARVESDYQAQLNELLNEKKEVEKL